MRFERRLKPSINIDLTPLIDVIFQLVIFFMITSVFKVAPGLPITLPEAGSSTQVTMSELRITALSETEIYVNKQKTSLAALQKTIGETLTGLKKESLQAVIEGDKTLSYDIMIKILDSLRANGIEGAALITRPSKDLLK